MDLATHALAGMAVGAAAARKAPLAAALATGVIASVLPDLDAWLYFINLQLYYEWHRLFTHTLLAAPVIAAAAAAAGLAIGVSGGPPIRPRMGGFTGFPISRHRCRKWVGHATLLATALFAVILHLSLDLLCDWPLRLLWPISNRDFALAIINYSHPAFTLGFALLALALLYPLGRRPLNGDSHLFWGQNR